MYAVVVWEVDPGSADPAAVHADALAALGGRRSYEIDQGIRMVSVASETDFVSLHEALAAAAEAHAGALRYAAWALRAGSPMRTNHPVDRERALEVIRG